MKNTRFHLCLLFGSSIFLHFSCTGGRFGTTLPDKRPAKMVIEMNESAGAMVLESANYYISEDSCYVEFFKNQAHNILRFKLTSASLDSLYTVFYENKFDKITSEDWEMYDWGRTSVTLRYEGKNISHDDDGSTYISKAWQKNFYAVVTAIINSTRKVVNENTVPFVVKFDKQMLADSLTIYFEVENFRYNSDSGYRETARLSLLKGEHTYFAYLMPRSKGKSDFPHNIKAITEGNLYVRGESDTLFVNLSLFVNLKDSIIDFR